ncbi:Hypothetical predicted protein [Mytilus galloprovincialis]|uniref:C3H1-type domain-containing protein n=1 Tax=Mytilus galloprovincialis TaxID=29158 RepID=A0A8B6ENS0_MYTGA|nr:Hypothetical predicted protein [Mytilus galloprovincialis]
MFPQTAINTTMNMPGSLPKDPVIPTVITTLINCVGALSLLSNLLGLSITKFVSGKSSPILILMRNLLVVDLIMTIYGIFKSFILQRKDNLYINCFLPECLFISASLGSFFFLLWMNADLCCRLTKSWTNGRKLHKANVNTAIMLFWNFSLVLGFLPIIGWNNSKEVDKCNPISFYNDVYLSVIASFWMLGIIISLISMFISYKCMSHFDNSEKFLHKSILTVSRQKRMIVCVQFELGTLCLCFTSEIIIVHVIGNFTRNGNTEWINKIDSVLLFCAIAFQSRSLLNAISHFVMLSQMKYKPNVRKEWTKQKLALRKTFSIDSAASSIRQFKNSLRKSPRIYAIYNEENFEDVPYIARQEQDERSSITPSHLTFDEFYTRAQDESRICKYYNIGDCWRGDRCPYRHVEVTSDGVTLDQELVYGAVDEYYMEKILPEPGTWVAVEVTTVLNPGHFYVSLPFGKSAIDNLKEKEEIDKKDDWQMNFDQLISEMQ